MLRYMLMSVFVMLVAINGGCATTGEQAQPVGGRAPFVVVLGIAQDAGYPQAACRKTCCANAWDTPTLRRYVSCLAIVDPVSKQRWLIDATPDLREQLHLLDEIAPPADVNDRSSPALSGILLTHAHIGHYTGLQNLGREVTGAHGVPVYAMPRMRTFLRSNGPWSQLVEVGNIELRAMTAGKPFQLGERITVTPLLVPHRDEFSEAIGFRINGPDRAVLYIPDIDKWQRWDNSIASELLAVDVAYLDGTFFRNGEIPGRDMSEIPHPFIEETMKLLALLPADQRQKVRFIHLNHTNPALAEKSEAANIIRAAGFHIARQGEVILLGNNN